jgi:hypothetical protein
MMITDADEEMATDNFKENKDIHHVVDNYHDKRHFVNT